MDSKIVGIPLVVWIFVIFLAVVILAPIWFFMHVPEMRAINNIAKMEEIKPRVVFVTPVATATPSATPSPVLKYYVAPQTPTTSVK